MKLKLTRMRELRLERHLTQQDVAKYLGISQQVYSNYERGARSLSLPQFVDLCEFYNVSSDYMLGLTNLPRYEK